MCTEAVPITASYLVPPIRSVLSQTLDADDSWFTGQTKPSQVKLSRQVKNVFPFHLDN